MTGGHPKRKNRPQPEGQEWRINRAYRQPNRSQRKLAAHCWLLHKPSKSHDTAAVYRQIKTESATAIMLPIGSDGQSPSFTMRALA